MARVGRMLKLKTVRWTLALFMVAGTTLAAMNVNPQAPAQRAKQWAAVHQHNLPTSLSDFAAYPGIYRQEMLQALSADQKSEMWRAQLQYVMDTWTLNAKQRAFLQDVYAKATPASFAPGVDGPNVCADIHALFPDHDQASQLVHLGDPIPASFSWRAELVKASEAMQEAFTVRAGLPDCNCHGGGWCECSSSGTCFGDPCNLNMNCGCIWSSQCDGVCGSVIYGAVAKKGL